MSEKRLIDANALLDFIHNGQGKEWFNSTSNRVRCGECVNRNTCDCPLTYAVQWGIGNEEPSDDDFCSYGERKEATDGRSD